MSRLRHLGLFATSPHWTRQVISQSAGDLGRGIEELSTGLMTLETALRQEMQRVDQQLRTELEELNHAQFLSKGMAKW